MGVFPSAGRYSRERHCLPHARGGVSRSGHWLALWARSSPRPWGCFRRWRDWRGSNRVFPTPVGVFLLRFVVFPLAKRLPHARGGVSILVLFHRRVSESSPRPWGCFLIASRAVRLLSVFPTPVGVFLPSTPASEKFESLPHARGGVSNCVCLAATGHKSSPRPWGCFQRGIGRADTEPVFPTPVGVFLQKDV